MSEAPFNPVAPALANAVRDATGRRLTDLPLTRDRVFAQLNKAELNKAELNKAELNKAELIKNPDINL
jgi:hypothetical protein